MYLSFLQVRFYRNISKEQIHCFTLQRVKQTDRGGILGNLPLDSEERRLCSQAVKGGHQWDSSDTV